MHDHPVIQQFDKSFHDGARYMSGFIERSLSRFPAVRQREASDCLVSLKQIAGSESIFREDGRGIEIHVIETFLKASELVSEVSNFQAASMAKGAAYQATHLSAGAMMQVLDRSGNQDAWLLVAQFREFGHIPPKGGQEQFTRQVIDCFNSSGDDYAKSLAILLQRQL